MLSLEDILALTLFAMLLSALIHAIAKLLSDAWYNSKSGPCRQLQVRSRTPLLNRRRRKNKANTTPKSKPWWRFWEQGKKSLVDEEQGPEAPALPPRRRRDSLENAFAGFDETHAAAYDDVDWSDEYIMAELVEDDLPESLPALLEWGKGALPSMPDSFKEKYELQRTFGTISCAPVHFVTDRVTGEDLVIKQLKCRQVNGESVIPNEAKIVSQHLAPHPNIMAVRNVHMAEDGEHFPYANVVMEHCKAGDLLDFLYAFQCRGTPVPAAFILHFVASMVDALTFIHAGHIGWDPVSGKPIIAHPDQAAVLHRDIKPDNIFMQWRETSRHGMPDIILADFGLAALESDNVGINGTPGYWAPEVHNADLSAERFDSPHAPADWPQVCSKASDMYSFALTLFELMTLRRYQPGEDIRTAFNDSTVSHHEEILIVLEKCLVEAPEKRESADAFHFVSHAFKQRLQNWDDQGDRIPDHVWPAAFTRSRDGIAEASSKYSARPSRCSEDAVAGASMSSASCEDMAASDKAFADLEQTLAAMDPGYGTMSPSSPKSKMSWSS
ncbi:unnamed protein product [Zymoseptoria tritici ST99CH_1A5]|uniref:non-specific serine/threonine protein kinase n=2 Tax=Zymoseptoria tritici TaxID=1047171 RepID=A0A1X7S0J0_ZYMT9|nr:unnamed protein product [Zymoseptoria tritici ST99CH_3D7]SMR59487.1 unnamed protein product [Zymoseptoria tritici ST99CH_3D1]SMY26685.1 unnamed protein product [Zymoseptoria tritici ST99CH_1A5]